MCDDKSNQFEENVKKLYGEQINCYARGSKLLEEEAIKTCIPEIAALTLPEHYASIVLTSRMDNELRKLLERTLHRQGDSENLLFEYNCPLGTFSAKINAAFSFGFLTKNMFNVVTYCRKIRNVYAHTDNPDEARNSKDYKKYKQKLMSLDADYISECIKKFKKLYENFKNASDDIPYFSEITTVMLAICNMLGLAAFYVLIAKSEALRFPCAFFGSNDIPRDESISKT